ncbi:hypothetical protein MARI151_20603 [Maribacter litoralis]|uniref:Uncharacterized protein n=1 Tax=Maribacter litoralis TaxID=2059726 RepID=A0A653QLX3_9FLAO|nr:hypothetical protein MARI151_20603 [Maribacter litoralis]
MKKEIIEGIPQKIKNVNSPTILNLLGSICKLIIYYYILKVNKTLHNDNYNSYFG